MPTSRTQLTSFVGCLLVRWSRCSIYRRAVFAEKCHQLKIDLIATEAYTPCINWYHGRLSRIFRNFKLRLGSQARSDPARNLNDPPNSAGGEQDHDDPTGYSGPSYIDPANIAGVVMDPSVDGRVAPVPREVLDRQREVDAERSLDDIASTRASASTTDTTG